MSLDFHDHKFAIVDEAAVGTLLEKLFAGGSNQPRRDRLFKALEQASRNYAD